MIGGEDEVVNRLDPIFKTIAPGQGTSRRPGPHPHRRHRPGGLPALRTERCRPLREDGAQRHRVRDDGGDWRGLSVIKHANVGKRTHEVDAETAPLRDAWAYQYDIDVAEVAEVWRRGSVVGSWLIDLTASALARSPELEEFSGRVSDSGEGRWTVHAAVDEGVPASVITTALYQRFESRDLGDFTDKVLSAMRSEFGGHAERNEAATCRTR